MKQLTFLFACICMLAGNLALAQSNPADASINVRKAYESQGIHFDQVQSMISTVTQMEAEPAPELLMDFLRTIETFKAEGAPVPMSEDWLNRWINTHGVSNEQAQDLYKVALRLAVQPRRE